MTGRPGRRDAVAFARAALLACALAALAPPSPAPAADPAPARSGDYAPRRDALPEILNAADAALYREVFALQETGDWAAADRRIGRIADRVLMGHVLAQRYMHPTGYRSRFAELASWLKLYADHPDARRIHDLALRRKPAKARIPPAPRAPFSAEEVIEEEEADRLDPPEFDAETGATVHGPGKVGKSEASVRRALAGLIRRERMSEAEKYLAREDVARKLGRDGIDRARTLIAAGWFRRGEDERSFEAAAQVQRRAGARAPAAIWWAGLAAFRLERFEEAIGRFNALARVPGLSARDRAAADFWAARAALRGGKAELVGMHLDRAARHNRTFYGQIAARIRGDGPRFNWHGPIAAPADLIAFAASRSGRRTFALIQLGEEARAAAELNAMRANASGRMLRTVIALTETADMPGATLRAARGLLRASGERVDAALYPIPHWLPEGGFSVDRALVFALAHKESSFNERARSRAGARGVMQLMPATARFISDDGATFRGEGRNHLYDPNLNLALGQKYVAHLLSGEVSAGNLAYMLAAYNGGPGNLARWRRALGPVADPLIFIESIPVRETRMFITQVLENLWIYRARLGQDAPSLDALATGQWPAYVRLDRASTRIAEERP